MGGFKAVFTNICPQIIYASMDTIHSLKMKSQITCNCQLEKVLGETHVPAKEKLLWLVNNAGSLWCVPDRKRFSFSLCIFLI